MDQKRLAGKFSTFLVFSELCLWVASAPVALAQNSSPAPHDSLPVAEQRAFLNHYCVTCHNDKLRTAQLSLQNLNTSDVVRSGEVLEKVVRKLATGAMPPASAPKPEKTKAQAFLTSLEPLSIMQRRLTRTWATQ